MFQKLLSYLFTKTVSGTAMEPLEPCWEALPPIIIVDQCTKERSVMTEDFSENLGTSEHFPGNDDVFEDSFEKLIKNADQIINRIIWHKNHPTLLTAPTPITPTIQHNRLKPINCHQKRSISSDRGDSFIKARWNSLKLSEIENEVYFLSDEEMSS